MKKIVALALIAVLALSLAACGSRTQQPDVAQNTDSQDSVVVDENNNPVNVDPQPVGVTPTVVVTPFPAPSSTPEPTPTIAPTPTVAPTPGANGYAAPTATATEDELKNGYTAYVQGSGINVRAEAGSGDTPIIDVVNIGDKVIVLGEEHGWTKVSVHNQIGYIYSPFIATTYPIVNQTTNDPSGTEGNVTIVDNNGSTPAGGGGTVEPGTAVIIMG